MDTEKFRNNMLEDIRETHEKAPGRLNAMLNLQLLDCSFEEKSASFAFHPEDWARNGYGGVHGGIISSVFDTGVGLSAESITEGYVSTSSLQLSFLRPMLGDHFRLDVHFTHIGTRVLNAYAELYDQDSGLLCADCLATFMLLQAEKRGLRN